MLHGYQFLETLCFPRSNYIITSCFPVCCTTALVSWSLFSQPWDTTGCFLRLAEDLVRQETQRAHTHMFCIFVSLMQFYTFLQLHTSLHKAVLTFHMYIAFVITINFTLVCDISQASVTVANDGTHSCACTCDMRDARCVKCLLYIRDSFHSETPPGENQNLFATLTVCTYVWIVPNWTLQQSTAISTERQVQQIAYQSKL